MIKLFFAVLIMGLLSCTASAQGKERFDSLQQKMGLAFAMGNFRPAANFAFLSLAVARQDLGETHIEVGNQYNNIAVSLMNLNKFDSAFQYFQLAETFFIDHNYTGTTDFVNILISRGSLFVAVGNYDSAIADMSKARKFCDGIKDCKNSESFTVLLNNLAGLYVKQNRNREAEVLLMEADKVSAELKLDYQMSGLLIKNSLAVCYINLTEYQNALHYLEQIEPLFVKNFGAANPNTVLVQSNMFVCYYKLGEKQKADSLGNALYKKTEKLKDKTSAFTFLNNYAIMLNDMGHLQEADRVYNSFLDDMEKLFGRAHPEYRNARNSQVILLQDLGQMDRAYASSASLMNSIPATARNSYFEGMAANNFMTCLLHMDSLDKAIIAGTALLEQLRNDTSTNIREIKGTVSLNMATAWQKKRMYKKSLGYVEQAIQYIGDAPSIALVVLYQQKAVLLAGEKRYAASLATLQQGLTMVKKMKLLNSKMYRRLLFNMISTYAEAGQIPEAAVRAQELLAVHQRQLTDLLDYLTPTEREYLVSNTLDDLDYLLDFYLYAEGKNPHKYLSDFLNVLLFREGLLLKTQTATKKSILQSNDTLLLAKYQRLQNLKANWIYQLQLPLQEQQKVEMLEKEILVLEKEMQSTVIGIREKTPDWKKIAAGLAADEAYIHFYQAGNFKSRATGFATSNNECYAVVIRRDAAPELVRVDRDGKIASYFAGNSRTSLVVVSNLYNETGTLSLYQSLWKPLEKHVANVNRIYLRTNGEMNRISFAAIPLPGKKTLSDKYVIRRLIVLADSSFNWDTKPGSGKNILLIGDVDFNTIKKGTERTGEGPKWEALPDTRQEVTSIFQLLKQKKYSGALLMDSSATEDAVKKAVNTLQPAIVHVATHGFFTRRAPQQENSARLVEKGVFAYSDLGYLQSGIVLAGANESGAKTLLGNDGILNSYEIQGMDFQKTDLVVLSACETALGNIDRQEGVYGLQRAFKIAGAKYQVLSLWKVRDKETRELMTIFYEQLAQDKTFEEAFNTAQSTMKKKYDPYFWAGFVLLK